MSPAHDAVVLALPFSTLRKVELHSNLGLSPGALAAIDSLGYGTNAKMMVGFTRRPWIDQGSNGASYSDLTNHQATWETNPGRATATRAILTDYSGGDRGFALDPNAVQVEANLFLSDLNLVFPGAQAAARRSSSGVVAHLEHWPSNPLTLGSYTCYLPGQFTTIAGLEGIPAGNIYFAGEHANSFYDFQGFMEGAALSGIDAATAILRNRHD
jgi:monoamine oxidase